MLENILVRYIQLCERLRTNEYNVDAANSISHDDDQVPLMAGDFNVNLPHEKLEPLE